MSEHNDDPDPYMILFLVFGVCAAIFLLVLVLCSGCTERAPIRFHRYSSFEPRADSLVESWPHVYGMDNGQARAYVWPTERNVVTGFWFYPDQGVLYNPHAVFVGAGDTLALAWSDADTAWRPSGTAVLAVTDSDMIVSAAMQMARTPYGALAAGVDSLVLTREVP